MKNLPQKIRSRKLNSRVDLTAMVSVSFLLIIFFMIVGELSKPKTMDLGLPDYDCDDCLPGCIDPNRIFTILLDDNDQIITYGGILKSPVKKPQKTNYSKNGVRSDLTLYNKNIIEYSGDIHRGAIVIIKPSKKCNFKNLVDILDEMAITKIDTYAIINDFTPEETKLLASN